MHLRSKPFFFIISLLLLITSFLGCKKQQSMGGQIIPAPFYFQLFNAVDNSPVELTENRVKIWYDKSAGNEVFIPNIKSIKMKSGIFETGIMSQEISSVSVFKNVNVFYVQVNYNKIDTLYLHVEDLGDKVKNVYRFPITEVKFNGKVVARNEQDLPSLWLLK